MKVIVSAKTAELARRKGYDWDFSNHIVRYEGNVLLTVREGLIYAFMLQLWLREKHNLHVITVPSRIHKGKWHYHRFNLLDENKDSEPELCEKLDTEGEAMDLGLLRALERI